MSCQHSWCIYCSKNNHSGYNFWHASLVHSPSLSVLLFLVSRFHFIFILLNFIYSFIHFPHYHYLSFFIFLFYFPSNVPFSSLLPSTFYLVFLLYSDPLITVSSSSLHSLLTPFFPLIDSFHLSSPFQFCFFFLFPVRWFINSPILFCFSLYHSYLKSQFRFSTFSSAAPSTSSVRHHSLQSLFGRLKYSQHSAL